VCSRKSCLEIRATAGCRRTLPRLGERYVVDWGNPGPLSRRRAGEHHQRCEERSERRWFGGHKGNVLEVLHRALQKKSEGIYYLSRIVFVYNHEQGSLGLIQHFNDLSWTARLRSIETHRKGSHIKSLIRRLIFLSQELDFSTQKRKD